MELVACDEVGEHLVLALEALGTGSALGGLHEVEGGVRRQRHRADSALQHLRGDADGGIPLDQALDLAGLVRALDLDASGDHVVGPPERVLEVVDRREDRVGDAEVEGVLALEGAVLLQRVLDDDLERVLDADEVREDRRAAPAGDETEEHLGQRERRRRCIDGAVVGVQADLESATERQAVVEHERRHADGGELSERVVAELHELLRGLLVGDLGDLRKVGAGCEDERLSGDGHRVDLAGSCPRVQLVEHLRVLEQRGRPERVRSCVVSAVVEGDQRERLARGKGDVAHVRVRDHLVVTREGDEGVEIDGRVVGHAFFAFLLKLGFSQIMVPPWPRPTHMLVIP